MSKHFTKVLFLMICALIACTENTEQEQNDEINDEMQVDNDATTDMTIEEDIYVDHTTTRDANITDIAINDANTTEIPTIAQRVFIRDYEARQARCNDGSAPAYYRSEGVGENRNKWIIFLEGGVGCDSPNECLTRWTRTPERMSSRSYPPEADVSSGIMSRDITENPHFHGWTQIYLRYCSSDYYLGRLEGTRTACTTNGTCPSGPNAPTEWYFQGHTILKALIEDLADPQDDFPSLVNINELIFAGCSAGSDGARHNIDSVTQYIQALNSTIDVKIRGLFDAEWEPQPPDDFDEMSLRSQELVDYFNAYLDQSCVAATPDEYDALCVRAWFVREFLETPSFLFMDQLDSFKLNAFGIDLNNLTRAEEELISTYTARLRSEVDKFEGAYCPKESWHCGVRNASRVFNPVINGISYYEVFSNWYFDLSGPYKAIDDSPLPWE